MSANVLGAGCLTELQRNPMPSDTTIWQGVTVEHPDYSHRIDLLCENGAHIKFLSLEPLLALMPKLKLRGIKWVIVGGESGPGARPMDGAWVRQIRDRCNRYQVPFFFKQWGGTNKALTGRILDERTWDDMPALAGVR